MRISLVFTTLVAVLSICTACPPSGGRENAQCDDQHPCASGFVCKDKRCTAQISEDAGPVTQITPTCNYDTDCSAGKVCDDASHHCIDGLDCASNPLICGFCEDGAQDCGFDPAPAYCDPNASVCRRIHSPCQPCHSDAECTTAEAPWDNHCTTYADGRFCAPDCAHGQSCPRGFRCDEGACLLEEGMGTCSAAPGCTATSEADVCPIGTYCTTRDQVNRQGVCLPFCLDDNDCQSPLICRSDPGPRYGTCINGCTPPGSSSGANSVCHETGRFGAFCTNSNDCLGITGFAGFDCVTQSGECAPPCQGWCQQSGCDDSSECPLPRTYCEQSSRTCLVGCAVDEDCGAFELCNTATHACEVQPCRGKDLSCNIGQWCCGKELFDASNELEHRACPSDVEFGTCFEMSDPYCRQCEDNDDCGDIQTFGYPSYCYELKTEDEDGNEISLGKYCSVGCETSKDCPRGITCIQELPDPNGGSIKGCIDAPCVAENPQ